MEFSYININVLSLSFVYSFCGSFRTDSALYRFFSKAFGKEDKVIIIDKTVLPFCRSQYKFHLFEKWLKLKLDQFA